MTRRSRKHALVVDGVTRADAPFSTAVICEPGRLLFVSGLLARDGGGAIAPTGDAAGQTRRILATLATILAEAGATLDDLVRLDIHLTDIARRGEVNAVRRELLAFERPTSTLVGVSALAEPDALVEITAIAALP